MTQSDIRGGSRVVDDVSIAHPHVLDPDRCPVQPGIAGAYLALAATYLDDLGYLTRIPVLSLVLIVVGVPLTAAAAGWLLAGREPPAIARPAIE